MGFKFNPFIFIGLDRSGSAGGAVDLTTDVTGVLPVANGGTNSSAALNNNRIIVTSAGAIVENAAITANRALASNASGIPVASATTNTELGFVSGVTSSIQTQLNARELTANKGIANGYASLDGAGKVPVAQLPNSIMEYQGMWNALTNSPALADGSGSIGDVYRVSTAGTQNLGSGPISFDVGDYVILNASLIWEKADTTDSVVSVNGQTGIVTLTTTNISEGTNLYFTTERAQDAVGAALTNTTTINLTYNDGGNAISADVNSASLTNTQISPSAAIDATKIANGTVSNTEFQRLDGILSSAVGISDTQTLTNKTIDADLNTISNIDNNEIKALAAIDATKIANGTVSNTEFQRLDGILSSAVGISDTQTLTNKTIDADLNTITNIDNNEIKAGAAIDATKIANGTVSNTEFQFIDGLTSNAQTQLNAKFTLPALTAGSVLFSDGTTIAQDNANLFFDDTNNRLGVGINTPQSKVHIDGGTATITMAQFTAGTTTGTTAGDGFAVGIIASGAAQVRQRENLSLAFFTNNLQAMQITNAGSVAIQNNTATQLATTATAGFLYIPSSAGTPTGVPAVVTATVPIEIDTTNSKPYFYNAGWISMLTPASTDTLTNKSISGATNTITNVSLTAGVTGTLPIANGGTGQTTASTAFGALSPLTTKGDILGFSTLNARVPIGADGFVLTADATQALGLKWAAVASGANTALSNLTPTSINQSLIPAVNNTINIGSPVKTFGDAFFSGSIADNNGISTLEVINRNLNSAVGDTLLNFSGPDLLASANFVPTAEAVFDLGSFTENWKSLHLNDSIYASDGNGVIDVGNRQLDTSTGSPALDFSTDGQIVTYYTVRPSTGASDDIGTAAFSYNQAYFNTLLDTNDLQAIDIPGRVLFDDSGNPILEFATDLDALNHQIINVATPTSASDAATKGYVDGKFNANDISETSFSGANNQASPANITGFLFSNASVRSFDALVSIAVDATSDLFEVVKIQGIQRGADWVIGSSSVGDNTNIVFSITNAGQLQYTSPNFSGFVSLTINFRAITTSV